MLSSLPSSTTPDPGPRCGRPSPCSRAGSSSATAARRTIATSTCPARSIARARRLLPRRSPQRCRLKQGSCRAGTQ
eukprot:5316928-Alexandrium_andersonii.AAC.1